MRAPLRGSRLVGLIALVGAGLLPAAVASADPPPLPSSTGVFARVPHPGGPAGVAVADDGTVYVGTLNGEGGDKAAPSKVFEYSATGTLLHSWVIEGQDLSQEHGLTGITLDADGNVYIGDLAPPRIVRLDPRTGEQSTYATLRDVAPCLSGGPPGDCSAGVRDFPSWPDYPVFTADGTMYVTDSLQALVWRIPKGGGKGQIFLTDDRLQSLIGNPGFGPSGNTLAPDGRTLVFTTVEGPTGDGDPSAGRIWTLPIRPDGRPGELKQFWVAQSADAPDGLAFGRSGRLYVNLSGGNALSGAVAVISPTGQELGRMPATAADNQMQPVPFDTPLGLAFQGNRLLIVNSGYLSGSASSWALLTLAIGESGVPQVRPRVGEVRSQRTSSGAPPASTRRQACRARHRRHARRHRRRHAKRRRCASPKHKHRARRR